MEGHFTERAVAQIQRTYQISEQPGISALRRGLCGVRFSSDRRLSGQNVQMGLFYTAPYLSGRGACLQEGARRKGAYSLGSQADPLKAPGIYDPAGKGSERACGEGGFWKHRISPGSDRRRRAGTTDQGTGRSGTGIRALYLSRLSNAGQGQGSDGTK